MGGVQENSSGILEGKAIADKRVYSADSLRSDWMVLAVPAC